jgi:hypothetical protein
MTKNPVNVFVPALCSEKRSWDLSIHFGIALKAIIIRPTKFCAKPRVEKLKKNCGKPPKLSREGANNDPKAGHVNLHY